MYIANKIEIVFSLHANDNTL